MKKLASILLCVFTTLSMLASESLSKKRAVEPSEFILECRAEIKALMGSLHNFEEQLEGYCYEDKSHAQIIVRGKSDDFVDGESFSHPSLKWAQAKGHILLMPYLRGYTGLEQSQADSDMPRLTELIYECIDYLASLYAESMKAGEDENLDILYPFEWLAENGHEMLACKVLHCMKVRLNWSLDEPRYRLEAAARGRRPRVFRVLLTIPFGHWIDDDLIRSLFEEVEEDKIDEILSILKLIVDYCKEPSCSERPSSLQYCSRQYCSWLAPVAIASGFQQPLEIVRFLLDYGFPLDRQVDCSGKLLIHEAIEMKRLDVIDLILLRDSRQLELRNKERATPFLFAAAHYYGFQAADFLIEKGADKEARDIHGNTFLHVAIKNSKDANVEYILKKGADIAALNNAGETPLAMAIALGNPAIVVLLIERDRSLPIEMADFEALFSHAAQHEEALDSTSSPYDIEERSKLFGNMLTVYLCAQGTFLRGTSKEARVKVKTALLCLAKCKILPWEMQCKILLDPLKTELCYILLGALHEKRSMDEKALPLSKEIVSRVAVAFADRLIKILEEKGDRRSMSSICQPAEFFSPMIFEVFQARAEQLKPVNLEEAPNLVTDEHVARQM